MRMMPIERAAILLLSAGVAAGCSKEAPAPPRPPPQVSVVAIAPQTIPQVLSFVAQTESSRQVDIVARVSGFLDRIVYRPGSLRFQTGFPNYLGAMAVRPGGLRFDRDGASILVDARTPTLSISRVAFPGVMPATPSSSPLSAAALTDIVADWSYLIERNRVWSPSFLATPATRR